MSWGYSAAIIAGSFLLAGFFSGVENGLYALNRWRLRHRREAGWLSARLLCALIESPRTTVAALLVGTNVFLYALSAATTGLLVRLVPAHWRLFDALPMNAQVASALILILPVFVFAEVMPKNLFRHGAETLVYRVAVPLYVAVRALWPIAALLAGLEVLGERISGASAPRRHHDLSKRRLLSLVAEGAESGHLSRTQVSLSSRVMLLGEILAPEVMVPIGSAEVLDESAPVRDFLELARGSDIWRVLLRSPDGKIRGMANLYDAMAAKPDEPASVIRRSVTHVRLDETVARVLVRMQAARQQLAVVVDGELNPLGRITVGDLVGVITRSDWKRPAAAKLPQAGAPAAGPGGAEGRGASAGGTQGRT